MSEYRLSAQKFAIYTVHGSRCYLCLKPLDYASVEIDHIIPERLNSDAAGLTRVLGDLGLSGDFDVNRFEHWLPSCRQCNGAKSGTVFVAALIMLAQFRTAGDGADRACRLAADSVSNARISRALAQVEISLHADVLDLEQIPPLIELYLCNHPEALNVYAEKARAKNQTNSVLSLRTTIDDRPILEFRVTPFATVLYRAGAIEIVRTSRGTGYRVTAGDPDHSFYRGHCGNLVE